MNVLNYIWIINFTSIAAIFILLVSFFLFFIKRLLLIIIQLNPTQGHVEISAIKMSPGRYINKVTIHN